ncbi:MAG: hypothetical protein HC896_06580 [Bacteroidales bacterium]|nr:hypothetical protein [Bacteroidales bacterium]
MQPANEIGETAATLLLEQIVHKGNFVPKTVTLSGKLNVRASSLKPQTP